MMKAIGLKYYRFSVAWPRIVPTGHVKDGINQQGIQFRGFKVTRIRHGVEVLSLLD